MVGLIIIGVIAIFLITLALALGWVLTKNSEDKKNKKNDEKDGKR